ncbi:KilA-N domain-containing protein [Rhodomicrobium vannielii ATCC 17100]|uniref:KilA-N domain-containing protein n=1 Tax=Rhodomicrobium vannielii TaxID=1069 RepID=UPI00191A4C43|nr:KilA-N domain-containing protein [Rhodomicrobium vannielii]MBJ7535064.1 KilA-N domain-containing protein [Rhodomicrobium vannielii ATCC 17100]
MNRNKHELIPHTLEGEIINQRIKDGYVNATAMCNAARKLWGNYRRNEATQEFLDELSTDMRIRISELIQSVKGGKPELQGTWVHPKVAIHLAQWLSPRFAVQVTNWVYEWMGEGALKSKPELPFHIRRHLQNFMNVPVGHFSVLMEVTYMLVAPLEAMGYTLPESLWPDISQGKMFAKWLRNKGIDLDDLPTYLHEFEDKRRRPVRAKAYPESLLSEFRFYVRNVWMPTRAEDYFTQRDKAALAYLPRLIAAPNKKAS